MELVPAALKIEDGGGGGCDIEWRVMAMLEVEVETN